MPPKQKSVKMDLGSFLQDEAFGGDSWADDDIDFSSIEVGVKQSNSSGFGFSGGANPRDPAFGGELRGRRDEQEYPIPDAPPYKARIGNLPWDVTEEDVAAWISSHLQNDTAIENLVAPKDFADPSRLKGFAFVTFQTKDQLKKALELSATQLNGRNVYVSVAAPDRNGGFGRRDEPELDWGAARDTQAARTQREPRFREDRPRREEPEFDWGARGTGVPSRTHREPREPREDRPKREEPVLDWGSARDTQATRAPREPRFREDRPKREEKEFDWGARGTGVPSRTHREPREPREPREDRPKREEPVLDWGSARDTQAARAPRESRFREDRPKREEKEFDWGARGTGVPSRQRSAASKQTQVTEQKPTAAPKKSAFSVLATEDDESDEENTEEGSTKENKNETTGLEKAAANLSLKEDAGEAWTTVRKN